MKKALIVVLVVSVAVLALIPMFGASADRVQLRGDADGDGSITISDVTAIQIHLAKYESLSAQNMRAADVNGNGIVDINDASAIQFFLAEYDDPYGIGSALEVHESTAQTSTTKNYELPFVPA